MLLRTRIFLVSVISVLLVTVTLVTASFFVLEESEGRFERVKLEGHELLWQLILNNQMRQMEANTNALARDSKTRNAVEEGDIPTITQGITTSFNLLSAGDVLSGIEVTDTNGLVLVSVPENTNVSAIDMLAKQALEKGKVVRGLMSDSEGRLTIAISFPLYKRGQAVGAIIYRKNLNDAKDQLKENSGAEVHILGENSRLIYSTNEELYSELALDLPVLGNKVVVKRELGDLVYSVDIQPIIDMSGRPSGHLVTVDNFTESYTRQSNLIQYTFLFSVSIILLLLGGLFLYMNRSFQKLQAVIDVVKTIATGDLRVESEQSITKDETGQLTSAMGTMVDSIGSMVVEINSTSDQLVGACTNLSNIATNTDSIIQQQLDQTEQIGTAVTELNATAANVAKNTSEAAVAANHANLEATAGVNLSSQLHTVMLRQRGEFNKAALSLNDLNEDTAKINDIINVINGIAEQTNLLALNAAIEAARAGEQGRGFAVVADEVRTLATRTAVSTKEIDSMIRRFKEGTSSAVDTMNIALDEALETESILQQTTQSLSNIAESVGVINNMMTQIASASKEQTAVTDEVNNNVINIKTIANEVANGSKQNNQAIGDLTILADQLQNLVKKFKI
jgi:methyl-accepting chemotaxis protein